MRPEMLECIEKLVKEGLTVVGPAPKRSPSLAGYPQADKQVSELASRMWAAGAKVNDLGKGKVWADGTEMSEVFAAMNLMPDLKVESGETMPMFIHRTLKDAQIYFIANPTEEKISINPTFRVDSSLIPQLWNATDGTVRTLPQFTPATSGEGITIPVELDPLESAFIVFRKDIPKSEGGVNYPEAKVVADLSTTSWTVSFDAGRRGPKEPVVFESLTDWSVNPDKDIANYSGKAVYKTNFNISGLPEGQTYVDLGKVMVMAKVKVNGEYAGGAWTHPYRVNITPMLKDGDNTIEVEVVNTWRNRLIGDAALAPEARLTKTNFEIVNASEPLQSSGLLGPVRILTY